MAKDLSKYPFEIHALSEDEGGGYLINFTDFNKCFSDGETVEEAVKNGLDALAETIYALEAEGFPVPEPGSGGAYSGKLPLRISKTLHAQLARQSRVEGVSMNSLVQEFVAGGLGARQASKGRVAMGQYVHPTARKSKPAKVKKQQATAS